MSRLNQSGDTIVEVLLAIVVVSTILVGSFVSAQRSLRATRQSQERGEALKVAEAQIEQLRKAGLNRQASLFDTTASNEFCVDNSGNRQNLGAAFPTSVGSDNFTAYPAACKTSMGGATYNTAVIRSGLPATPTFVVHTRWDRYGGGGNEELTISYRLYP